MHIYIERERDRERQRERDKCTKILRLKKLYIYSLKSFLFKFSSGIFLKDCFLKTDKANKIQLKKTPTI